MRVCNQNASCFHGLYPFSRSQAPLKLALFLVALISIISTINAQAANQVVLPQPLVGRCSKPDNYQWDFEFPLKRSKNPQFIGQISQQNLLQEPNSSQEIKALEDHWEGLSQFPSGEGVHAFIAALDESSELSNCERKILYWNALSWILENRKIGDLGTFHKSHLLFDSFPSSFKNLTLDLLTYSMLAKDFPKERFSNDLQLLIPKPSYRLFHEIFIELNKGYLSENFKQLSLKDQNLLIQEFSSDPRFQERMKFCPETKSLFCQDPQIGFFKEGISVLQLNPFIALFPNVLSHKECQEIKVHYKDEQNFVTRRPPKAIKSVIKKIFQPLAEQLNIQEKDLSLMVYKHIEESTPSQVYHYDYGEGIQNGIFVVAILYLNTVPEGLGGETAFPQSNIFVQPQEGSLLVFSSINYDGNPQNMHAGLSTDSQEGKSILAFTFSVPDSNSNYFSDVERNLKHCKVEEYILSTCL